MEIKPDIRHLYDMKDVIYDKKWLKTAPNLELYYMYRGVKRKNGLRYDITVIPGIMLGQEYNKTKGHEHMKPVGELYKVLKGKAIYLMQSKEGVYAIKAKKGDVVIIPPLYSHITINPSKQELKMANWMDETVKSNYKPLMKNKGAYYFYTKKGWVKNKNYKKIPKLRFKKPRKTMPKDLSFLKAGMAE